MHRQRDNEEENSVHDVSRHRGRRPVRGKELYVTVSEIQLVAGGRLEVTCVSTIPDASSANLPATHCTSYYILFLLLYII
ncbi:unnamed protein product [Leptidea sinapis]|uniref:Uncharacterized protein n=1 Tax=Leptidea sinapis TaxID=189913 RepID=A0A5E4QRZ7_9NEOP|nr:unnamed protein product [Leptidea sinapis]